MLPYISLDIAKICSKTDIKKIEKEKIVLT